jgi:hypothetical protein
MNIGTTSIDALPISPQTQNQMQPQMQNQMQTENIKLDIDGSLAKLQQSRDIELLQGTQMQGNQMQGQMQGQGQGQGNQMQQQGQPAQINAMNQQNINQFVSGLQQASAAGLTVLPSRDIPQTQSHLTQDQQMQPNYVPQEQYNTDYITEHQTNEDIIRKYNNKEQQANNLDDFYSTIQTPVLIAILYFLFQLPVVRKNVFKFLPSLFSKDGNPNLSGYVVNSAIFAALYFSLTKGIRYFSL